MRLAIGLLGIGGLAAGTAAYATSAVSLWHLRRRQRGEPQAGFAPPVTIIKPLAGVDEGLSENLESFYRLDYPTYEIVYSFAGRDDPAYPIAREVADRHPAIRSTFVFDEREPGGNAKVNRLTAALGYARSRLVLFSDGNVRARADFLRRAVSWFRDPNVGLVSHLFRASGAATLGSRLEALYLNGCLLPGTALVADTLGIPCVVGKSILVSRRALEAAGGIRALRDYLAEDFVLGREVRRAGFGVVLSADVLDTVEVGKSLRAVWARHRRWSMMRRRLAGRLYAGELFVGALPWFGLAMISPSAALRATAGVLLAARWGGEFLVSRSWGRQLDWRDMALLPVRDFGAAAVFVAGLLGRVVAWRGRPMVIGRDTQITRGVA
jgi:ceramide glucosyltransferase